MKATYFQLIVCILTVFLVSGCTQTGEITGRSIDFGEQSNVQECPGLCDDGNVCTSDYRSEDLVQHRASPRPNGLG